MISIQIDRVFGSTGLASCSWLLQLSRDAPPNTITALQSTGKLHKNALSGGHDAQWQGVYHEATHPKAARKYSLKGSVGIISDLHKIEKLTSFYFLSLVEHRLYKSGKITSRFPLYQNLKTSFCSVPSCQPRIRTSTCQV